MHKNQYQSGGVMRIQEILAGWWQKSAQRPFFVCFVFIFLSRAVVETSHLLVSHHFIIFAESKSNQGPWVGGLRVINSWHNMHRGGVARWFLFSCSLFLFSTLCPILVDAGGFYQFQGFCMFQRFCRFQGGYKVEIY